MAAGRAAPAAAPAAAVAAAACLGLLLPLLEPAAAARGAGCDLLRLGNVSTEHGHQRVEVLVGGDCACLHNLSLYVQLAKNGYPTACGPGGSWHDTRLTAPVRAGRAVFATVVAGCFEARGTCRCASAAAACKKVYGSWPLGGLELAAWQPKVSIVQPPGLPLSLDVHASQAGPHYFASLEMRLKLQSAAGLPEPEPRVATVAAAPEARHTFGADGLPLSAGRYELVVRPAGSWTCQGANNGCPDWRHQASVKPTRHGVLATFSRADDDRFKALYAVVGVTLAVVAAGAVFVWRECTASRLGQGEPLAAKAAAPAGAHVLLVHLWSGERLAQLKAELSAAGLRVCDVQDCELRALFRAMPVCDALSTERLRRAKIVFLCAEPAAEPRRCQRELFAAVVGFVRNSALALDYRRVFVVLAGGADPGPAALVPACRFRWPADAGELARQLSVPAESDGELPA